MANKIINRMPSDAWLLGVVATVAAIAFGSGWFSRGSRGDDDAVPVRIVQPTPRPLTDALVVAFDVLARFCIQAESEEAARKILEDLLMARLDPTSTSFQPEPHAVLDCWAVEGREGWAE